MTGNDNQLQISPPSCLMCAKNITQAKRYCMWTIDLNKVNDWLWGSRQLFNLDEAKELVYISCLFVLILVSITFILFTVTFTLFIVIFIQTREIVRVTA